LTAVRASIPSFNHHYFDRLRYRQFFENGAPPSAGKCTGKRLTAMRDGESSGRVAHPLRFLQRVGVFLRFLSSPLDQSSVNHLAPGNSANGFWNDLISAIFIREVTIRATVRVSFQLKYPNATDTSRQVLRSYLRNWLPVPRWR
jgi:hypothetical protein